MMHNQASLQETKQHGAVRFPFNLYPCTIPGDFPQVALHWQESMELVFVKRGAGLVQVGAASCPAYQGDIFIFTPGTLHALRQAEGQCMEYENIIFELELLGGAEDLCAEKYLLPLQSGRLLLPARLTPNDLCYLQAAACLREVEEANRAKLPGYELLVTCLDGADNLYKADLQGRLAFVMGNEANGVSDALLAAADKRVFIPMQGRAESLNVAMAAGIVMFEALRQKLK